MRYVVISSEHPRNRPRRRSCCSGMWQDSRLNTDRIGSRSIGRLDLNHGLRSPLTTARQRRKLRERPGRKLLGLDLGERRVGVAVSDDLGSISFPVGAIDLRHQTLEDVARLAQEQNVEGIVAGLPTTLSGDEGFQARQARAMAAELAEMIDLRIVFWDERLTSAIADRLLDADRGNRRKNRTSGDRDAIAASIMLQGYLDANPYQRD